MSHLETVNMSVDDGAAEMDSQDAGNVGVKQRRRINWASLVVYFILPVTAVVLAAGVGYLRWQTSNLQQSRVAEHDSVRVATEGTVALLSYRPETVDKDLEAAQSRLTGQFSDTYAALIHDVVIPGAKEQKISAAATVPAAASVSTSADRAVVLLFVNQTVTVGEDAPTSTASSVRVSLEKSAGRWLISQFDPV